MTYPLFREAGSPESLHNTFSSPRDGCFCLDSRLQHPWEWLTDPEGREPVFSSSIPTSLACFLHGLLVSFQFLELTKTLPTPGPLHAQCLLGAPVNSSALLLPQFQYHPFIGPP